MRPIWRVRCVPSTVKGKIQTSPPSLLAFLRSFPQPHARLAIDELDVRPFKRSAQGGKIIFCSAKSRLPRILRSLRRERPPCRKAEPGRYRPAPERIDRAVSEANAGDLRQEYAEVSLLHLELTDWRPPRAVGFGTKHLWNRRCRLEGHSMLSFAGSSCCRETPREMCCLRFMSRERAPRSR